MYWKCLEALGQCPSPRSWIIKIGLQVWEMYAVLNNGKYGNLQSLTIWTGFNCCIQLWF